MGQYQVDSNMIAAGYGGSYSGHQTFQNQIVQQYQQGTPMHPGFAGGPMYGQVQPSSTASGANLPPGQGVAPTQGGPTPGRDQFAQ